MPVIVACPSCGGKLRVADALLGQRVRCPACNHTFDSEAAEPPPSPPSSPAPQDLPLQLSLDDPSSPPPPTPSGGTRGLVGAVEVKLSREDDRSAPSRAPTPPPESPPPSQPPRRPPRWADERDRDWDVPDIRRRGPRRDAEPDRGAVVLTLGIISVAGTIIYCAAPLWSILGLVAWIMGQSDLRKMKRGQMDDNGRSLTQAGWICGILGVVLNSLITLTCGGVIGLAWYMDMSRPPNTRPIPAMRPPPPAPPKRGFPPPNNPPPGKF